jgi:hypothetical protein
MIHIDADQSGRLVKNVPAIREGQTGFVDYNSDRILFYPTAYSSDFLAVVRNIYSNGILRSNTVLPLQSDSPDAFGNAPCYSCFSLSADVDVRDDHRPPRLPLYSSEVASTMMGPGPWPFHAALRLPSCSVLRFVDWNMKSNVVVGHDLKLVFRAEHGNETEREICFI